MIEDEKKEGLDNGGSSFQVIADQKAEQDYAINTYKGSGEMSTMMDELAEDAKLGCGMCAVVPCRAGRPALSLRIRGMR